MIDWMSEKVEKVWDDSNTGLVGIVCEIHDESLKGHIVLQLELGEDFKYQLDLGDCSELSNAEINERFVRKFPDFVKVYENSEDCCGPLAEDLKELSNKFLATID